MSDFINLIKKYGSMKSFRAMPSGAISSKELECPPLIVWEFQSIDSSFENLLKRSISDYNGVIKWAYYKENGKSVLSPKAFEDYRRENNLRHKPALSYFMENNPNFGISSNEDLSQLVEYLKGVLNQEVVPSKK